MFSKTDALRGALALLALGACADDSLSPSDEHALHPSAADTESLAQPNTWETASPMPTAREGLVTATVDGILYAIGGG